jgi:hypothetical protein
MARSTPLEKAREIKRTKTSPTNQQKHRPQTKAGLSAFESHESKNAITLIRDEYGCMVLEGSSGVFSFVTAVSIIFFTHSSQYF